MVDRAFAELDAEIAQLATTDDRWRPALIRARRKLALLVDHGGTDHRQTLYSARLIVDRYLPHIRQHMPGGALADVDVPAYDPAASRRARGDLHRATRQLDHAARLRRPHMPTPARRPVATSRAREGRAGRRARSRAGPDDPDPSPGSPADLAAHGAAS